MFRFSEHKYIYIEICICSEREREGRNRKAKLKNKLHQKTKILLSNRHTRYVKCAFGVYVDREILLHL